MAPEGSTQQWWVPCHNTPAYFSYAGSHISSVLIRADMHQHISICHHSRSIKIRCVQGGTATNRCSKDTLHVFPNISALQLSGEVANSFNPLEWHISTSVSRVLPTVCLNTNFVLHVRNYFFLSSAAASIISQNLLESVCARAHFLLFSILCSSSLHSVLVLAVFLKAGGQWFAFGLFSQ